MNHIIAVLFKLTQSSLQMLMSVFQVLAKEATVLMPPVDTDVIAMMVESLVLVETFVTVKKCFKSKIKIFEALTYCDMYEADPRHQYAFCNKIYMFYIDQKKGTCWARIEDGECSGNIGDTLMTAGECCNTVGAAWGIGATCTDCKDIGKLDVYIQLHCSFSL